ncbi:BamA/TamA family outer membrane protein [Mucilaginibacter psychrotolerans]|nr:BamA/TamA family outer membrane protein [Mucilaginibacter psychrotolerans]
MRKYLLTLSTIVAAATAGYAQQNAVNELPAPKFRDSMVVKVHPSYNDVTGAHKWLFGKNYREEWAVPVKLPIIRISEVYGGLTPEKEGGGYQSKSLRLKDKTGREWVIRSVEKSPDKLLPSNFAGTFAIDWLDDAISGQHPFSALIVGPMAEAANVPHSNPVIGVVADDPALGKFRQKFANIVCLLEEREPGGESDNTPKALGKIIADNDNHFDGEAFLRARLLDLLVADWDRHEDQWRWLDRQKGDGKMYIGVPRDRDQVLHVAQGLFPTIASLPFISPAIDNFSGEIPRVKYSIFKTRFIKPYTDAQIPFEDWMRITNAFVAAETDAVLEAGLRKMPVEAYNVRHDKLLAELKQRRDAIPKAMEEYYYFINRLVDIRTSDKNEQVTITDAPDNGMRVLIQKITKEGKLGDTLLDMVYKPAITHEIRLFVSGGDDHVTINTANSPINLRVVGGTGNKIYEGIKSNGRVKLYDKPDSLKFIGDENIFSKHLSRDTFNTKFVPTYPYNVWMPLATAAINADDGFLLGLGVQYTKNDGFRKLPYTSLQQLMVTHSFSTDAFRIRYSGEWIHVFGKTDLLMNAKIQAPDNTMNFFGFGNSTPLVKGPNYRRFYRTRFDTYQFDPALRWRLDSVQSISVGPSFQYYHFDGEGNAGRLITNPPLVNSYDSLIVDKDKMHVGITVNYIDNERKGGVFPNDGHYFTVSLTGYRGLNSYSKSYGQLRSEFTFYRNLTSHGALVLSDRVGGGITVGRPAFYQGMFLGGQGNLLGFLQNRFAGKHMVYNNFQARLKLANIKGYLLPGQLGISGFYDVGRVWADNYNSGGLHHGVGGGAYFSPAALIVIQVLAGHSVEGWYPYVSLNFRI